MRTLSTIAAMLLLPTLGILAQPASTASEQEKIGHRFLEAIVRGEDSLAWNMLDGEIRRQTPYERFERTGVQIRKMRAAGGFTPAFKQFAIRARQIPAAQKTVLDQVYTFAGDTLYPPRFTLSVSFGSPGSVPILGLGVNDMPYPSAGGPGIVRIGPMDQDLSGREGWFVEGDSVAIDGVTLVPFPNKEVMMVVKIFREMPDGPDVTTRAKAEARPIVRYALEHGYRWRATDFMLAHPELTLIENIGVVFATPGTTRIYRTQLSPEEYNAKE